MKIADLNTLYSESETKSHELFAEQRSNLLLVHGNHYTRRGSKFWRSLRQNENLTRQQKLRLTKNHIQRIIKTYVNSLLTYSPSVTITPKNEAEIQDRKAAELHNSVWGHIKLKHNIKGKTREWVKDFMEVGEIWLKVFYDRNLGDFKGYEPAMGEDGMPQLDDNGLPIAIPKFTGDLVFERFLGFNSLLDMDANSWEESRYAILRKMVPVKNLKHQFRNDEEKLKFISESTQKVYRVFDVHSGQYLDGKGLCMVREYYFRPTPEKPKGYYYIATEFGVLFEGEIPLGIWPIIKCGFDNLSTSARSYSLIKQLRPYQAEINRSASKIAEHQITIGDDKVVTPEGTTISPGGTAHGIKHVKVTGGMPQILQGRSGEQYLGYMQSQISEMYQISGIMQDTEKNPGGQMDPYALLFRSLKEKKNFTIYSDKFEEFLVEVCRTAIELKRSYCEVDELIPIVTRKEMVNIEEFKNSNDLDYQIIIEPMSEDMETKMGRQLSLNHILQYAGGQLDPKDVGKLVRAMPYVNKEEIFGDLTLDYDNANNDILSLDRGRFVPPEQHEDHPYVVKRLVNRIKSADFPFLPQEIQQMYNQKLQMHNQIIAQQEAERQRLQSGWIPTGGAMVKADIYVQPDPNKKAHRAILPYEALDWLLKKLEEQGSKQEQLAQNDEATRLEIARMAQQQQGGADVIPMQPGQV